MCSPCQHPLSWLSKQAVWLLQGEFGMCFRHSFVWLCITEYIFNVQCSLFGWRMLRDVSSIYLWSCTSAFSAIEPSAAVSQGKLTSLLIALLVITECSWSSAVSSLRGILSLRLSFLLTARSSNPVQRISWGFLTDRRRSLYPSEERRGWTHSQKVAGWFSAEESVCPLLQERLNLPSGIFSLMLITMCSYLLCAEVTAVYWSLKDGLLFIVHVRTFL